MKPLFAPEPARTPQQGKTAVLLINLGSPDAPTAEAVRPYLARFLSDQRVVELPKTLWQLILRGLILPFRPKASAHGYSKIWLHEGSPLAVYTEKQAKLLAAALPENIIVRHAMSYSAPFVGEVMAELKAEGVSQLLAVPLYPQYAASSSGAALDKVFETMLQQRNMMSLRTVRGFHNHPAYIEALREQVARYWQEHGRGEKLMMSFHGIPQAQYDNGDPYPDECRETARLLAAALGIGENDYIVSFQSQFGKAKWVGPSTQDLFGSLPKQGVEKLDVICPAFVADCLETMEEIALAGREQFHEAGGRQFHYIPCLNDNAAWIHALAALCRENLGGWLAEEQAG
ncbi:MAG: ferrochelatase [Neisseria sp.]|nr:ferrochelatase [Neisseria sp.]